MQTVLESIDRERKHAVAVLDELLRIPSVSTDPERAADVRRAADFLAGQFRTAGLPRVEIIPTAGHPIVYAEWNQTPGAPTVLIYGHYDVQPPGDPAKWTTPAFEPNVRDGKIYARGSTDDKGQLLTHVFAVAAHLRTRKTLPVNVKFVIEGEEEIGSEHLGEFLKSNREKLACDAVVISDTAMFAPGIPSLCTGLRGIAYTEFTLRGPLSDLHSGSFGGAVDNPAFALAQVLISMKDPRTGKILVDGFYDDVVEPTAEEKAGWAKLDSVDQRFLEMTGVPALFGEEGKSTLERIWSRPTLEINGIWGGFTGEGSMTVLPARASAKVSMRLVANQDPDDIGRKLEAHIRKVLPKTVTLERFRNLHGGKPWTTSPDHPAVRAAFRALERGFGKAAIPTREGGSIPIVHSFVQILGAPAVLLGFGLPDEGAHGPNEHFDLENFQGGIRTSAILLEELVGALRPSRA